MADYVHGLFDGGAAAGTESTWRRKGVHFHGNEDGVTILDSHIYGVHLYLYHIVTTETNFVVLISRTQEASKANL